MFFFISSILNEYVFSKFCTRAAKNFFVQTKSRSMMCSLHNARYKMRYKSSISVYFHQNLDQIGVILMFTRFPNPENPKIHRGHANSRSDNVIIGYIPILDSVGRYIIEFLYNMHIYISFYLPSLYYWFFTKLVINQSIISEIWLLEYVIDWLLFYAYTWSKEIIPRLVIN